jgi:hypothetical protein
VIVGAAGAVGVEAITGGVALVVAGGAVVAGLVATGPGALRLQAKSTTVKHTSKSRRRTLLSVPEL